jgi:hypothetical protein
MTEGPAPPPPGRGEMDEAIHVIKDHADRLFLWDYERDRGQLVTLYNKAMSSQWSSVTDLDWSTDVDPERLVAEQDSPILAVTRLAGRLPGSPLAAWSEKEYSQLGIEFFKANLSQFMHGEQGAMMTAAKIVETVPWIDAKYYASTQTMDEARHTEVFARYLSSKLGEAYPMSPWPPPHPPPATAQSQPPPPPPPDQPPPRRRSGSPNPCRRRTRTRAVPPPPTSTAGSRRWPLAIPACARSGPTWRRIPARTRRPGQSSMTPPPPSKRAAPSPHPPPSAPRPRASSPGTGCARCCRA